MKSTSTDEIQIQTDSTSSVRSHSLSCLFETEEKYKESLIWLMAPRASSPRASITTWSTASLSTVSFSWLTVVSTH